MKIFIISDLHANFEALSLLPSDYDELWVLGDLVNYGPDPALTIEFVRLRASMVVRGNHDNAVGYGSEYRCSPRFQRMAEAMGSYTRSMLSAEDKQYLRDLPACACRQVGSQVFFLCHATPSDPLYEYRLPDSPLWRRHEEASSGADTILVGHTHLPFTHTFGSRTVLNPGSLGQSKAGDPRARYAIWEDGRFSLQAFVYPVQETIRKIQSLPLPAEVSSDLSEVLRTGRVPARA
jgi:putative phosphoesterase